MIHIKYEKADNYPHDKKIILFDRNAFQSLSKEEIHKVNKRYNILCPNIFVIECMAPNNTHNKDEESFRKEKKALREKLQLIENPLVLTGSTNVTRYIRVYSDHEYTDILDSWQIARNCIVNYSLIMKCVSPQVLVSRGQTKVEFSKYERRKVTEIVDDPEVSLTPNRVISFIQKRDEVLHNKIRSRSDIKNELRKDPSTHLTQELANAARHALSGIKQESKAEIIGNFKVDFGLNDRDTKILIKQIPDNKKLTVENYPLLSYPIYIHYLIRYMLCSRQQNADHLDSSYYPDFQYLHYLNFCDMFVANEKSTPHIVNSIPYDDIRETPIITGEELKNSLN